MLTVKAFRIERRNSQSEMISLCWNLKASELLLTYINLSLASFSVLHCSLILVNLGFNILVETFSYFAPNVRDQPWRCTYFVAKLLFIAGTFIKNYSWYMKIHSKLHLFPIWSILTSSLSIITWKALSNGWSLSELVMFLEIDSRNLPPFGKFQDTKEASV